MLETLSFILFTLFKYAAAENAIFYGAEDIGLAVDVAALAAKGESRIDQADIIYRGYEQLPEKLRMIGADVNEISY